MKNKKHQVSVAYKSVEQFKSEHFPGLEMDSSIKSAANIKELAVYLADDSFNKVLQHRKRSQ